MARALAFRVLQPQPRMPGFLRLAKDPNQLRVLVSVGKRERDNLPGAGFRSAPSYPAT